MHLAVMITLIVIAALSLIGSFFEPKMIGRRPRRITVGEGLRTLALMMMILGVLIYYTLTTESEITSALAGAMIFLRAIMFVRYAGRVDQNRPVLTWQAVSTNVFLSVAEAGVAIALLVIDW